MELKYNDKTGDFEVKGTTERKNRGLGNSQEKAKEIEAKLRKKGIVICDCMSIGLMVIWAITGIPLGIYYYKARTDIIGSLVMMTTPISFSIPLIFCPLFDEKRWTSFLINRYKKRHPNNDENSYF